MISSNDQSDQHLANIIRPKSKEVYLSESFQTTERCSVCVIFSPRVIRVPYGSMSEEAHLSQVTKEPDVRANSKTKKNKRAHH